MLSATLGRQVTYKLGKNTPVAFMVIQEGPLLEPRPRCQELGTDTNQAEEAFISRNQSNDFPFFSHLIRPDLLAKEVAIDLMPFRSPRNKQAGLDASIIGDRRG